MPARFFSATRSALVGSSFVTWRRYDIELRYRQPFASPPLWFVILSNGRTRRRFGVIAFSRCRAPPRADWRYASWRAVRYYHAGIFATLRFAALARFRPSRRAQMPGWQADWRISFLDFDRPSLIISVGAIFSTADKIGRQSALASMIFASAGGRLRRSTLIRVAGAQAIFRSPTAIFAGCADRLIPPWSAIPARRRIADAISSRRTFSRGAVRDLARICPARRATLGRQRRHAAAAPRQIAVCFAMISPLAHYGSMHELLPPAYRLFISRLINSRICLPMPLSSIDGTVSHD